MGSFGDKLAGLFMFLAASLVFIYYTIWTLILPFIEPSHAVHAFFPPREWAIRIPVVLLITGATVVGSFVGMVLISAAKKDKAKKAK